MTSPYPTDEEGMMEEDIGRPLRAGPAVLSDPSPQAVSAVPALVPDAVLSLDNIRAAMKAIESIPPKAMLASSHLFPREHALRFNWRGRDYLGAHPDFWKRIPASSRGQVSSLAAIEIADFDLPYFAPEKAEFMAGLAQAMSAGTAETEGLGAKPASAVAAGEAP